LQHAQIGKQSPKARLLLGDARIIAVGDDWTMSGSEKELILLGLFFVVAVNEDSAVVSGAVLSYKHVFPAWEPFVACFLGMWISDFGVYAVSRFGGRRFLDSRWMQRILAPKRVQHASRVFEKWGGFATVFSRFVLGSRTALLVASGLLRYPANKFLAVTFVGAVGWLLLVYSLFDFFGVAATALFGFRWITALTMMLFGGAGALFLGIRRRRVAASERLGQQSVN
jgi:membrane protein DedA with SNARE-associated domain